MADESGLGFGHVLAVGLGFGAGVLAAVWMEHANQGAQELDQLARETAWKEIGRSGDDYDPSDYAGIDHWSRKEVLDRADRIEASIRNTRGRGASRSRRRILND